MGIGTLGMHQRYPFHSGPQMPESLTIETACPRASHPEPQLRFVGNSSSQMQVMGSRLQHDGGQAPSTAGRLERGLQLMIQEQTDLAVTLQL